MDLERRKSASSSHFHVPSGYLGRRAMSERSPSQNSREEVTEQTLDSSFVYVNPKNYRKYFKKGKVFRSLWPEPINPTEHYRDGVANIGRFGEAILVKIRWFVVVQSYTGHCLVVPVHTYDGRGATKSGINADDHCALVAKGQSPVVLDGERLDRAPLHLILENPDVRLKSSSRINFSKVYTVEYNVKISTVGRIAPEDVPTMGEYWHQSIAKVRGETTSVAQSSKSVHLNKPMDDLNVKRSSINHHKSRETVRRTTSTFNEGAYPNEFASTHRSDDRQTLVHRGANIQRKINLDWITSTMDHSVRRLGLAKMRRPEADEWILASPKYRNWQSSIGGTLFCPGLPGSRKTMLTSIVVNDLQSLFPDVRSVGLCYVYSNNQPQDRQSLPELVSLFLEQLLQKHTRFSNLISKMNDQLDMFGAIVTQLSQTFIVIDGLDEIDRSNGFDQSFLRELFRLQVRYKFNFLGTSRFVPSVTELFAGSPILEILSNQSLSDMYLYLDTQMSKFPDFVQNSTESRNNIVLRIWDAADKIFLLAHNFLEYFVNFSAEMSFEAIDDALKSLRSPSSTLANTWHISMERAIAELVNGQERAKDVFMWIVCTRWPLTASALQHALAVEIGSNSLRPENIPSLDDLCSACAGFLGIDEENGNIFLNPAAKDCLVQNQSQWFSDAHRIIADTCATYLFFDDFSSGWLQSEEDRQSRFETFPFYPYATWNWWYHTEPRPDLSYINIWNVSPAHVQAWYQSVLYWAPQSPLLGGVYLGPGNVTLLHIAAFLDQDTMIDWMLNLAFPVDVRDGQGSTPLSYAAGRGSMRALERLLERGADINTEDTARQTPLMWAFREGQKGIGDFLLGHGAHRSEPVFPLASQLWFS